MISRPPNLQDAQDLTVGINGVLGMHSFAGLLVAVLVIAHIALVIAADPANLGPLDLINASNRTRAVTAATVALGGLIGLAVCSPAGTVVAAWRPRIIPAIATPLGYPPYMAA